MSSKKQRLRAAVAYWSRRVYEGDIGVDWCDAEERCWRCGDKTALQLCHILAAQFGGQDEPSNIVGLCAYCHDEAPDVRDPAEIWRWMKATRPMFYGTLKAERALAAAASGGARLENLDIEKAKALMASAGIHWGQLKSRGAFFKESTMAWVVSEACREESQ